MPPNSNPAKKRKPENAGSPPVSKKARHPGHSEDASRVTQHGLGQGGKPSNSAAPPIPAEAIQTQSRRPIRSTAGQGGHAYRLERVFEQIAPQAFKKAKQKGSNLNTIPEMVPENVMAPHSKVSRSLAAKEAAAAKTVKVASAVEKASQSRLVNMKLPPSSDRNPILQRKVSADSRFGFEPVPGKPNSTNGKRNHELRENNEGPDQLDYSEDEEEGDDIPRRHSEKNSRPKGQLETNDNDYSEAEERSDDLPLRHPKKRVYSRKRLEANESEDEEENPHVPLQHLQKHPHPKTQFEARKNNAQNNSMDIDEVSPDEDDRAALKFLHDGEDAVSNVNTGVNVPANVGAGVEDEYEGFQYEANPKGVTGNDGPVGSVDDDDNNNNDDNNDDNNEDAIQEDDEVQVEYADTRCHKRADRNGEQYDGDQNDSDSNVRHDDEGYEEEYEDESQLTHANNQEYEDDRGDEGNARTPPADVLEQHRTRNRPVNPPHPDKLANAAANQQLRQIRHQDSDDEPSEAESHTFRKGSSHSNQGSKPTTIQYYPPGWRSLLETCKISMTRHTALFNSFPEKSKHLKEARLIIANQIAAYRNEGKDLEPGITHDRHMDVLVFDKHSGFRQALKAKGRTVVQVRYHSVLHPDFREGNQLALYEMVKNGVNRQLKKGLFMHGLEPDDNGRTQNLGHPAIRALIHEFFYADSSSLASLYPEDFSETIPDNIVGLTITCLHNCLQEYAYDGVRSTKGIPWEGKAYRKILESYLLLIDKLKRDQYHGARYRERCAEWARAGM